MKAKVLLAAMGLVFAGSAMAASSYQDDTNIHFAGEVLTNLCVVGVNGGNTVTLDPSNVSAIDAQSGSNLINEKPFTITVDCSDGAETITGEGLKTMRGYLTAASGTEVDATTLALKNTDTTGAQNVGFGVLNSNNELQTFTEADVDSRAFKSGVNKYTFDYKVGYMKVADGVTPGLVAADSTFIVDYQ